MQNYWNLYLACKQQQLYGAVNYRDFREFYVPFAQTVDQPVGHVNGKQPEFANVSHNLTKLVSMMSLPLYYMYLCLIVVYTGI